MDILARYLEAIAFICALVAFVLITIQVTLDTDKHIDARRRADLGDKWWHEA